MPPTQSFFNPFPGLRPFDTRDKFLFFGREEQTAALLGRLRAHRFLAVVGTSGSGKSSLVRAGMIPGLHSGFMAGAGPNWRVAVLRPGGDPMGNLARALEGLDVLRVDSDRRSYIRATLARSAFGLTEFVQQSDWRPSDNLLVVVDQFEEIFRFRTRFQSLQEEAGGFVRLLLEAAARKERPIYVVLTMRSDFLGDCAEFAGLAEAINEGEYLIPRMKRDQCRLAIEGPVRVGGGRIAGRLVQRLLNDMGTDPDQLPVLQHALMRTWDHWAASRSEGEPLDLRHYEAVGGMARALSRHADEVYAELAGEREHRLAAGLFRALTEVGPDNRGIRRPTRLGMLAEILDAPVGELRPMIDRFRQPGRTFLVPPVGADRDEGATAESDGAGDTEPSGSGAMDESSVIDLSHESLMRLWDRLQEWVRQEAESASIYRRLAESARLRQAGRFDLYRDPELQLALNWQQEQRPNAAWGERYAEGFESAMRLLDDSRSARESARREARRRRRALLAAISVVALLFFVLWLYAERQRRRATSNWLAMRARESVGVDPRESVLLARAAVRSEATRDAVAALRSAVWDSRLSGEPFGAAVGAVGAVGEASFDPRGGRLIMGSESNVLVLALDRKVASRILTGHTGQVTSARFSPDGATALSAGRDGLGILWNTADWTRRATLSGHSDILQRACFSRSGTLVATAGADGSVRLWDASNGVERARLQLEAGTEVWSVDFAGSDDLVAVGTDRGEISLWRWADSSRVWGGQHSPTGRVLDVRFAPGDRALASAGDDGRVVVWGPASAPSDLSTATVTAWERRSVLGTGGDPVNRVDFSPGGRLLATAGDEGTARLWEWASATPLHVLRHPGSVKGVAFDATGRSLLTSSTKGGARLWSTDVRELPSDDAWSRVRWVAFAPDASRFVAGVGTTNAVVFRYPEGERLAELKGHSGVVSNAAFHPKGEILATGGGDRSVRIWSARDGSTITNLVFDSLHPGRLAFSPDGRWLAVARRTRLAVLETVRWQTLIETNLHDLAITALAFSSDSRFLATSGLDNRVRILRTGTWTPEAGTPLDHPKWVNGVAFAPGDPELLATAAESVRFFGRRKDGWRPLRGTGGGPTNGVGRVEFVAGGPALFSAHWDGGLDLWDAGTRGVLGRLLAPAPAGNVSPAKAPVAAFDPLGRGLIVFGPLGLIFENPAWAPLPELLRRVDERWSSARPREESDALPE